MAKVRDICTKEVVTGTPDTTISAAAQLMRRHHVGTLVVCDRANGGRRVPIGIVTDRDIVVEVVAPELRPDTITVGDIMDRRLATVGDMESALAALEIMKTQGVRRLPVVRKNGTLVGLVSTHDLVLALPSELADISIIVARGRSRETRARK